MTDDGEADICLPGTESGGNPEPAGGGDGRELFDGRGIRRDLR